MVAIPQSQPKKNPLLRWLVLLLTARRLTPRAPAAKAVLTPAVEP